MNKKNQCNFVFPDEALEKGLRELAEKTGVPMAKIIRLGIQIVLDHYRFFGKLPNAPEKDVKDV